MATLVGVRHRVSGGRTIDVVAMQRQMEAVISLRLTNEQVYGRTVAVQCTPSATDGASYSCLVTEANPSEATQFLTEIVTCDPEGPESEPYCSSNAGEAVQ